jgi:hypothetical protein
MMRNGYTKNGKPKLTEHAEQCAVIDWRNANMSRVPTLRLLHATPNGAKLPWRRNGNGQRYSPEAIRLKAEGLVSGIPDLCLPVPMPGFHGLYVEMKVGRNKPSEEQEEIIALLREQGHRVEVCYSAEDAIKVICEYLIIDDALPFGWCDN